MTGSEERPRTQPITEVKAGKGYHLALAELSLCAQLLKSISNLRIIKKKKKAWENPHSICLRFARLMEMRLIIIGKYTLNL